MIYFLYGPDTYRSRKKLHEIADGFRAAHGVAADLQWWDGAEDVFSVLAETAGSASLFGKKKMIVLERVLALSAESGALCAFLEKNKGTDGVLSVVWEEGTGAKDEEVFARIKNMADKSQEFGLLSGARLEQWIRQEARRRSALLPADDMARLMALGGDLWAVAGEIEKIAVRAGLDAGRASARAMSTVFNLGDSFFSSPRAGLRHLLVLQEQGEDAHRIFSYLANYLRTVLAVKAAVEERRPVPPALEIKDFVAKKAGRLSAGMDRGVLAQKFRRFFEEDDAIKTGGTGAEEAILRILFS